MPTDSEMPTVPAADPAIEAAAASALIRVLSRAVSEMLVAEIPDFPTASPSPSINALTSVRPRFSTVTPAPLRAMPAVPPAATATDPANVRASIDPRASASRERLPSAFTDEFAMKACTCAAVSMPAGRTSFQRDGSPKSSPASELARSSRQSSLATHVPFTIAPS